MASRNLNSIATNKGALTTKMILISSFLFFGILIHCNKKEPKKLPRYISTEAKLKAAEKYLNKAKKSKKTQRTNNLIRAARLQIETGKLEEAKTTLNILLEKPKGDKRNLARALYLLARITSKNKIKNYLLVIHKYPNTAAAVDALYFLIKQWRSTFTPAQTLDKLIQLQKDNGINNLADNLAFAVAKLAEELYIQTKNSHHLNLSVKNYKKIWFEFNKSPFRDDALYNHALFLLKLGKLKKALTVLDILLDTKESSWIFGNYNSEFLDDALFKKGKIFIKLKNYKAAIGVFSSFSDKFKTSRLNDDAAYQLIKLYNLTNKSQLKCKKIKDFLKNYKSSRYFTKVKTLATKCSE